MVDVTESLATLDISLEFVVSVKHCVVSLLLQENIEPSVQQQVISESKHLVEVTDSLATLDIALGFLVSVGGNGETKLADFISKTLEMNKSLHTATVCMEYVFELN